MEKKFPSQLQDKFTVRFPEGMRDKIAEKAKENNRSMNAEIILALEKYLESQKQDVFKSSGSHSQLEELEFNLKKYTETIKSLTKILENKSLIKK